MGFIHAPELIIVLIVAVIFLGPKRLPDAGKSLGKAIRGFREETKSFRDDVASVKDETHGIHSEVMGVRDTLTSSVNEAVHIEPKSPEPTAPGPA